MTRYRVLRIQSRICIGGPALNTILLSAHLPAERFQSLLVGGRLEEGEKSLEPFAHKKGVAIHMVNEMGRSVSWLDDLRALIKMIKVIRYYRPHIVHTHTAKAGAIGRLAAFLCRVPIRIHTFHGHVFHGYFGPVMNRLVVWVERFLAFISTRIIAISPTQRNDLTERFRIAPPKKCALVRLGFELRKMTGGGKGRFRAKWGLPAETLLVGILARLVPIKNHQLLISAMGHWFKANPTATAQQVRFLIVGDGPLRDALARQAQALGVAELCLFTGWETDVADLYADLHLNVLVSKNEGTPVTLIEGLAAGVPILATDVGGIRDFADDACGSIVPANVTPEVLGDELGRMLGAELKGPPRVPESKREEILATFDVTRLVADMADLYNELIDKKGLPGDNGG